MSTFLKTSEVGWDQTRLKAAETAVVAGHRVLEFYASAFTDVPDKNNDIMDPHAFDKWLPEFYAAGQALQISFNHAAMLDPSDPTNVIGYAPADPDHVWVDDYGLRVKAFLDVRSEKGKAVEYQIEKGLLKGASLAFGYLIDDVEERKDGANIIKSVTRVMETGLVPNPAQQAAVLLWMKSEGMITPEKDDEPLPYMTVEEFRIVLQKGEPDPLLVQTKHDEMVAIGAVCKHDALDTIVEEVQKSEESQPDMQATQDRMRKLRLLETSLP
jgi:HK97 family phage prohead protease